MAIEDQELLFEREGGIATVIFNRPHQRNAFSPAAVERLAAHLDELARDPDLRALVFRGAGDRAFSSGYDLAALEALLAQGVRLSTPEDPFERLLGALERFPAPAIACIRGVCVGGGCTLAAACDIRLAADTARFGMPPAKLGLVYSHVGLAPFLRLLGPGRTAYLFFSGDLIDAQTAHAWGLADRLYPADQVEAEAYALAQRIAANAPLSVRGTKLALRTLLAAGMPDEAARAEVLRMVEQVLTSRDWAEGRAAFHERRAPRFEGR